MLVAPEGDFKRLADHTTAYGRPIYSMGFGMNPRSDSRWLPYLIPSERLIDRFGVASAAPTAAPTAEEEITVPRPMWRSDLGFLGESELVRVLAEREDLNLFRPFPDLETSELAVLHIDTRRVTGFQIKTISVDAAHRDATVSILASSFHAAPTTWFAVLAWLREESRFHDDCLLIQSEEIRAICEPGENNRHLEFDWHPGSSKAERLQRFRHSRLTLKTAVG